MRRRSVHLIHTRLLLLLAAFWLAQAHAAFTAPDFDAVRTAHPASWAVLLDHNGRFLHAIRLLPDQNRLAWVPLAQWSPAMQQAVLISEDQRFYRHHGVDWQAVLGATWENLRYSTHRGASTLSMQLVGLLNPNLHRTHGGRTLDQKWQQAKAATTLEQHWSKAQILEAYLNLAPLRAGLTGVHAAAQGLFATAPEALNPAQSAILAALLRGPNARPATVNWRACHLAQQMSAPPATCQQIHKLIAQHFDSPPVLFPADIAADAAARLLLHQPGQTVTSSLDIGLQQLANNNISTTNPHQSSAIIILDNANGAVLAYASEQPNHGPAPFQQPMVFTTLEQPLLYAFALTNHTIDTNSVENNAFENNAPLAFGERISWLPHDDTPEAMDVSAAINHSAYPAAWRVWHAGNNNDWNHFLNLFHLQAADPAMPAVTGSLLDITSAWQTLANQGIYQPASFQPGGLNQARSIFSPNIAASISGALAQPRPSEHIWISPHQPTAWLNEHNDCQTQIIAYTSQVTVTLFRQAAECDHNWQRTNLQQWRRLMNQIASLHHPDGKTIPNTALDSTLNNPLDNTVDTMTDTTIDTVLSPESDIDTGDIPVQNPENP